MNKKFLSCGIVAIMAMTATFTSCEYDDNELWNSVNNLTERVKTLEEKVADTNNNLTALQQIVEAIQNQVTVTSVQQTADGYEIHFSDGQIATITNGINGTNAPEISVISGDEGLYYWTLDGEVITVDGKPLCANGIAGNDGIAPQIRINSETKMWEISVDGGKTWTDTGVKAEGSDGNNGNSLFTSVNTDDPAFIVFTLANGTELKIARYDEAAPIFAVKNCTGIQQFLNGETVSYIVEAQNIADYSISKPDGWSVKYTDGVLSITAPVKENTYAENEGSIAINTVSSSGRSLIVKVNVEIVELRILTFEDADAKFTPYTLDYCSVSINTWSDLIDDPQYGGTLLYGSGMGMDEPYYWYDEGNTELMHQMPQSWGTYCYWGGGHAITNYYDTNLDNGDFSHQLSVYGTSGHNGSQNCAMHYGYRDNSGFTDSSELCSIEFADGIARVIDHIWIMNSTYAMNCYVEGNGLTAQIGPDDWVKIVAIGYDAGNNQVGECEFYTCNGPEVIVRDWTKWDLSSLGKVTKVEFNILGSSDNGYGFSQPAYFAYDDVAVRFSKN